MKTRYNFRSLAELINDDGTLLRPKYQGDHPIMKGIEDLVYFNALSELAQAAFEKTSKEGRNARLKDVYRITKEQFPDDAEEDFIEMLFLGLLEDAFCKEFLKTKKEKDVTARDFYNLICRPHEKDKAVLKLAAIFDAIADVQDAKDGQRPEEERLRHISKQEFDRNKDNRKWVMSNLKALKKSSAKW